jgi:hypothetical protein
LKKLDDKEFVRAMVGKNDFDGVNVDLSGCRCCSCRSDPDWHCLRRQMPLQHRAANYYRRNDSGQISQQSGWNCVTRLLDPDRSEINSRDIESRLSAP